MVRSRELSANAIVAAMEAGDFYASTGVRLKNVRRERRELSLNIDPEPGVTYKTEFIGTLEGFDPTSTPGPRPTNSIYAVTRHYSEQIGAVLAVAEGTQASYKLQGDEIYVRAKVISSKRKTNPYLKGETETAWTQPLACSFDYVWWQHGDEAAIAYFPALEIEVVARGYKELLATAPEHLRGALRRSAAPSQPRCCRPWLKSTTGRSCLHSPIRHRRPSARPRRRIDTPAGVHCSHAVARSIP
jgi:hypothetical protein